MKRVGLLLFVTLIALLALGVPAFAHSNSPPLGASSETIYNDFVQHYPKLSGSYNNDDLRAYLNDATFHEESNDQKVLSKLDRYVEKLLGAGDTGKGDDAKKPDDTGGKGGSNGDDGKKVADNGKGAKYSPYQVVGGHPVPFSMPQAGLILLGVLAIAGGGLVLRRVTH